MRTLLPVLVLGMVACGGKPPVEAPSEISELSAYLFENFSAETDEELVAGAEQLLPFLKEHDFSAPTKDRTYALEPLQPSSWGAITGPDGQDPADQIPVAVVGKSRHDLDANRALAQETNHVCIESNTTVYYQREFLTDEKDFVNGDSATLETLNEVRKESFVAKIWYDLYKDYRVVESEDGDQYMFGRQWIDQAFDGDGGNNSFFQLYIIEAWLPLKGGETARWFAMYSAVQIGGVDDNFYASLVEQGISEGYVNADNFIDGDLDKCSNDRDYEPDPRE